jgi:Tol biopolymer transport system component
VLFGSQADESAALRARTYSPVSAEITDLGGPEGATDYSAAWSPDGSWIAIDRNVPVNPGQFGNQVWLVRPSGAEAHVLLQGPGAAYSSLAWSPDGRHLLYARYVLDLTSPTPGRFDIYMTDVETGESQLLVEGGDMPALLP